MSSLLDRGIDLRMFGYLDFCFLDVPKRCNDTPLF